eukprot:CAMPEP_0174250342 /NCGR_PEP_ID=MMETSP0439-20130205/535_1 /TAXON_ID=0 /ORGANISM="Stereomyxa ramosa, Strain Chinc5" /LENGTH=720 /DNA_ID=CAMNT_0015330379 /DNA_START=143 /DNA_END=2305 /DNA_ORIENTATION=+
MSEPATKETTSNTDADVNDVANHVNDTEEESVTKEQEVEGKESEGKEGEEGSGEEDEEEDSDEMSDEEFDEHDDFVDSDDSDEEYYEGDDLYDDDDEDDDLSAKLNELRGMMGHFYPFGQNQYTSVDLVLSKESFELEELLELDDFLPDLRRGKNNLLSYLVQTDVLEKLIAYISSEPQPEEDESEIEKNKRFAHLAYEAIQSDVLKEAMINNHKMLDKFFDFLDITTEMDPLRCAYFSRIVELLFERYPKELVAYLRKKNCIVAKFVWHINNQYIVESLFRLIDSQISHQWLHDEDLIPLLMFKMAECEDPETQEKTAATFVEILDLFVPFPYSILTTQMFHSEIVAEQWEEFTLSEETNFDKIQNGLNVAIGILNLSYEGNIAEKTPVFMQTVTNRLSFFLELLKNPRDPSRAFDMTYGRLSPPFGFLRVKILEFLCALLNTRYPSVVNALWSTEPNIFETLLDILFFYKWNNTLHYYVDQVIATIMSLDDNGDRIIEVLINKCELIKRFTDSFKTETDRTAGYIGHLVHLSNELIKASTYYPPLSKILKGDESWQELTNGKLKEINRLNDTPIGGGGMGMGDQFLYDDPIMGQGEDILGEGEYEEYEGEDPYGQADQDDYSSDEEDGENEQDGSGSSSGEEDNEEQPAADEGEADPNPVAVVEPAEQNEQSTGEESSGETEKEPEEGGSEEGKNEEGGSEEGDITEQHNVAAVTTEA